MLLLSIFIVTDTDFLLVVCSVTNYFLQKSGVQTTASNFDSHVVWKESFQVAIPTLHLVLKLKSMVHVFNLKLF